MAQLGRLAALVMLAVAAYLAFWPVPISPVAWQPPVSGGYAGPHAANGRLSEARVLSVAPEIGPEHVAVGPDGWLYTGALSGAVLRMRPDGSDLQTVVETGGRPLGLDFTADGRLVIADAFRGLLQLSPDGTLEVLTDAVDGDPIRYADAVLVADDGRILFTDASQRLSAREWGTFEAALLDILEHSCTGRVLEYSPGSRRTRTVLTNLCFPNGLALSGDGRYLFIAETGSYQILKVDAAADGLDARTALATADPRVRPIATNLPGYPDNLTRSSSGRLWTGLTKPRSALIDRLAGQPWLRAMVLRLPKALWPVPPAYGHVIAFDEEGRVLADLQDPAGRIPETSGVTEHDGRLYVHSLHGQAIGVLDAAAVPTP